MWEVSGLDGAGVEHSEDAGVRGWGDAGKPPPKSTSANNR